MRKHDPYSDFWKLSCSVRKTQKAAETVHQSDRRGNSNLSRETSQGTTTESQGSGHCRKAALNSGADEFTDLLGIYSLTSSPPATFRNLNDYDVGAMVRHPSVLPSSRAHQNREIRYGSDCDQGQRRPGGACLSPM